MIFFRINARMIIIEAKDRRRRFGCPRVERNESDDDTENDTDDEGGDTFQNLHLMIDDSPDNKNNNNTSMLAQGLTRAGLLSRVSVGFNVTSSKKAVIGSEQQHNRLLNDIGDFGCAKIASGSCDAGGRANMECHLTHCDSCASHYTEEELHWKDPSFLEGSFRGDMTKAFRLGFIWTCDMHTIQNVLVRVYEYCFGPHGLKNPATISQTLFSLVYYQGKLYLLFDDCHFISCDKDVEIFIAQYAYFKIKISFACATRFITQSRQVLRIFVYCCRYK